MDRYARSSSMNRDAFVRLFRSHLFMIVSSRCFLSNRRKKRKHAATGCQQSPDDMQSVQYNKARRKGGYQWREPSCLSCRSEQVQMRQRTDRQPSDCTSPSKQNKKLWASLSAACSSSQLLCASQDKASEFDSLSLSLNKRPVLSIKRVFTQLPTWLTVT